MADSKLTALTALTTPAGADLLYIVDDVAGTATGKKITLSDLFGNVPVAIVGGSAAATTKPVVAFPASGAYSVGIYNPADYTLGISMAAGTAGGSAASAYTGFRFELTSLHMTFGLTSQDTGLKRQAAGVVQITDGSTGTGKLIFIVPTSDPGISGALWNNGGSLAISA